MLKPRKLNGTFGRFSKNVVDDLQTFRGAIKCGNMFITEITHNTTIQYNVKLLASRCFFITSNIRFLIIPVYLQTLKDTTYSLNFISVILCTHSVYFVLAVVLGVVMGVVLAVVLGVASLADFHGTTCSLFPKSTISFNRT